MRIRRREEIIRRILGRVVKIRGSAERKGKADRWIIDKVRRGE